MQFFTIVGIVLYFLFVTKCSFEKVKNSIIEKPICTLVSIDYVFAKIEKGDSERSDRASIIQERNRRNLINSFIVMVCSFFFIFFKLEILAYLLFGFNGYRFISRSSEIMIAFVKDCFNSENKSELYTAERLKLAMISYFEIYLYSAAFYVSIIHEFVNNSEPSVIIFKSIMMSLSVGTMTNVAYSQDVCNLSNWLQLLPFIQVFTVLSLVVLSFAVYVSGLKSRKN